MAIVDTPLTMPAKKFETDSKAHKANAKALEDFAQTLYTQLVPVGAILMYGGISAPTGWLMCNGASLQTSQYPTLFQVIGYAHGGSGANFNLPKMDSNSASDMTVPLGVGVGVSLGTRVNVVATTGTAVKGAAVNFIIKT